MPSQPAHVERRVPLSRILKWTGTIIIAIPLIALFILRGSITNDIQRLRQQSIDRGEPQTMAEVIERHSEIKPDDNAALAILDLWAEREENHPRQANGLPERIDPNTPFVGRTTNTALPWPSAELKAARLFAKSRVEWNQKMKNALSRPKARFPVNYEEGLMLELRHISSVKHEVSSLQVENFLAIQEGSVEESVESLRSMARTTNTLRDEHFLISQLVRIATTAITLRGVEQLITWRQLNAAELDELLDIVNSLEIGNAFYRAMIVERVTGLSIFEKSLGELSGEGIPMTGKGLLGQAAWGLAKMSGYLSADQRLMMDAYDKVLVLSTNLHGDSLTSIAETMNTTMQEARRFPPKLFTGLLFPALEKSAGKFLRVEAERRMVAIALAIEAFRLNNDGALPRSLGSLHDELPVNTYMDPFGPDSIQFHPKDDGYLLFSIGIDLTDNQGNTTGTGTDVVLRVTHLYDSPND